MQARRRAQPSGTNSPSSSHPRLKHRARCVIFCPCPPCGRQGRPGKGTWQARIHEPRGSAPRERDHRGGDHPVPSRTRQLSPPSPRVLQRKAAGGQGVALAEGAFLLRREGPAGGGCCPCGPLLRYGVIPCIAGPPISASTGPDCRPSRVRVWRCRMVHAPPQNQRIHGEACKSVLHNGADAACAERTLESVYRRNLVTYLRTKGS